VCVALTELLLQLDPSITLLMIEHDMDVALRVAARVTVMYAEILVLCHGGPIAEPDDAAYVLERTDGVVGFFGANSMERLPTEVAMTETMRRFKTIPIREERG
jgi:predicted TIM-barrel enzyme